jgi:hypothetical protein
MAGKPPTLERTLADMQRWPKAWEIDGDREIGARLVAGMIPFVRHLYEAGVATTTLRRYINNLAQLGGEVIRQRHFETPPGTVPPLAKIVDEEGGPLLHCMDEREQRPFDATCRALHRFLTKPAGKRVVATRRRLAPAADLVLLDALIDQAVVDAHDYEEQAMGFLGYLDEQVRVPFSTVVLGRTVMVTGFTDSADGSVVAVCKAGRATQHISLLNLPLPTPPPQGHEWIAAYRRWCTGGRQDA